MNVLRTDDIIAVIRTLIRQYLKQIRMPQKGIVSAYDPVKYMAKVTLQPQGIETGWLQIGTMHAGNGFGITTGLYAGQEVQVSFESGDLNSGTITLAAYTGQQLPVTTQPGEIRIHHDSGSYIDFMKDGGIKAVSNSTSYIKMFPDGTVEIHAQGTAGTLKLMADQEVLISSPGTVILNTNLYSTFITTAVPGTPYNPALHVDHIDDTI